jgi:transposase
MMRGNDTNSPTIWQEERKYLLDRIKELENRLDEKERETKLLLQRITELEAERKHLLETLTLMNSEFEALKRHVYGKRSEKMPSVEKELEQGGKIRKDPEDAAENRKKHKEQREKIRKVEIKHPADRNGPVCPKCGTGRDKFRPVGEGKKTTIWEYIPASFVCEEHVQEVLACPCGEHMITAEGPARVIEGGTYGPSFISHILVSKAADSIPLYRMEKQFARLGIPVARATMVGLFHRAAERLKPLAERIILLIRASEIVLADETPIKMQEKYETGESGQGYLWTFIANNLIAYRFSPSRSGETPKEVLGGSNGTLVVDAYTGYNKVISPDSRERAGCMAHLRRKFFDALGTATEARTAMDFILDLYKVEHEAKEKGIVRKPEHLRLRQKCSKPVMDRFHAWLVVQQSVHLPQGPMGKAISYALNNWKELSHFLLSEQVPLDNNASERALRVAALGRKNFLFVGHDEAGKNLAVIYTLIATCEANCVNPEKYLADVLLRVQTHPNSRIDEILPQNWKPSPNNTNPPSTETL